MSDEDKKVYVLSYIKCETNFSFEDESYIDEQVIGVVDRKKYADKIIARASRHSQKDCVKCTEFELNDFECLQGNEND